MKVCPVRYAAHLIASALSDALTIDEQLEAAKAHAVGGFCIGSDCALWAAEDGDPLVGSCSPVAPNVIPNAAAKGDS